MEQWRDVVGYEGLYEVSDMGQVRTTRRKGSPGGLRKLHRAKCGGYWAVSLCRDGRQVTRPLHAILMEAFIGPRPDGMETRHLDGDPGNARLSNLAYGTPSDNALDRVRHGTHNMTSRTHCPKGHPYDEENTFYLACQPKNRKCRACDRARKRYKTKSGYGPASSAA